MIISAQCVRTAIFAVKNALIVLLSVFVAVEIVYLIRLQGSVIVRLGFGKTTNLWTAPNAPINAHPVCYLINALPVEPLSTECHLLLVDATRDTTQM